LGLKHSLSITNDQATSTLLFRVEQSADWLWLKLAYERPNTWMTASVWDSEGKLRLSHLDCNNAREVVIHRDRALSSDLTVSGEIAAGEWIIEFTAPVNASIEWEAGSGSLPPLITLPARERVCWTNAEGSRDRYALNLYDWQYCREHGARWYKGDFHTHTIFSDGQMTPEQNMDQAERMGLDFFVATDHNVLSTSWPIGKTLVIPGIEITSGSGHWNALGLRQWIDWRPTAPDGGLSTQAGMDRLMEEAGQLGALRSVNHPMLTPWAWVYTETPLALIDTLEIWNDPTYHTNPVATEKALVLWNTFWNEGFRIPGIGGSGSHLLPTGSYTEGGPPSLMGDPATYVYADRLSADAILSAVRAGRVYVSRGPVMDVRVTVDRTELPLGSDLTEAVDASEDGVVHYRIHVNNVPEGRLIAVENGTAIAEYEISSAGGSSGFAFSLDWKGVDYVWRRYEIRSRGGELLAFTNPVSYGRKTTNIANWGQLLEKAAFDVPVN